MNGDLGTIYKAINEIKINVAEIKTTQDIQHKQNHSDIKEIKELSSICVDHETNKNKFDTHWRLILILIIGLLGVAWKALM